MEKREITIHHIVSIIGGFLGTYGIITRANFFGSAETTNMIAIIVGLFDKDLESALLRSIALIIYMTAIVLTVAIPRISKLNVQKLGMWICVVGMIGMMFLPASMNPIIALFPVFFLSAFIWNAFPKAGGYNCSTIFSTNNLRQTIIGFTEYVADKKVESLAKGKFFGMTLVCYHIGVVYACIVTKYMGLKASVAGIVPVVAVMIMLYRDKIQKTN
jgi:uncharacterized membrane protein YoaK (UPF0700 family)